MIYRLTRVEPWSAGRTLAAVYVLLGLLTFVFGVVTGDIDPAGFLTSLMFFGLLLPGIAFLGTALGCMVFNVAAKWSQGIMLDLEPPHEARQSSRRAAS